MHGSGLTVSLDQFHWVGLAKAIKHPQTDPTYTRILELGTELRQAGRVRFPLSTDRYHETLRLWKPHQRIDVAYAMALLSGYETMLQLDSLTLLEIDAALCALRPGSAPLPPIDVFGHGVMHAFGRQSLSNSLRVQAPADVEFDEELLPFLTGQMRAVARELMQDQFEWGALSGDPRLRPLDPSIRADYDRARQEFATEEQRRSRVVHDEGLDPRKAGLAFALALHMDQLVQRSLQMRVPLDTVPLETDPVDFIQSIPTVHVLGGLLAGQYRNSQTVWKPTDWADMRTLCQAVVYCDAVAPDRHWADAVERSGLPDRYATQVLVTKTELLDFLEDARG